MWVTKSRTQMEMASRCWRFLLAAIAMPLTLLLPLMSRYGAGLAAVHDCSMRERNILADLQGDVG